MKKNNRLNQLIAFAVCAFVLGISIIIAKADDGTETNLIPVQDGIRIMLNDTVYVTNKDSVTCHSVVIDGLISTMENDFTFKGVKLKRNHPNYGIFQDAAERYFNDIKLMYIRTPKGKVTSDKQKDINEYGVPKDRKLVKFDDGEFHLVLFWDGHKNTYDEYGKRLFEE